MSKRKAIAAITVSVGLSWFTTPLLARPGAALTDQDRAEIRQLLVRYARALSTCASRDYADLFTPDGVFISDDFRGAKHRELYGKSAKLAGREKLIELVETEEFCLNPVTRAERARAASGNANPPQPDVVIEATAEGARGTLPLGRGGRYEDLYVKTAAGWRFKSRSVFMPPAGEAQPAPPTTPR
jgi:hypothetical protein